MIRWVAAVVALLIMGCATVQSLRFEQPDFDLTSVRVDGLGLTGGSLTLLIDVDNPNAYDLRTGQIDVAIDFEGTRFGEAFLDGSTRFGSQAVTAIELPLSFNWGGLAPGRVVCWSVARSATRWRRGLRWIRLWAAVPSK